MPHAFLADAVLILHGLFIVWVVAGAAAVWWRAWLAALQLPALAWGVWVSFSGATCPLTPLEQSLRRAAGQAGHEGGFIEHHLGAVIYPAGLTPAIQILLGVLVIGLNAAIYARLLLRRR